MSTISREAVMKEIDNMIEELNDKISDEHIRDYIYKLETERDAIEYLKSRIESIPQEPVDEWISVEEKEVPKDGKEYLVIYTLQGNVMQLVSWNKIHKYYQSKGEYKYGFQYWKPLSKPLQDQDLEPLYNLMKSIS